MTKHYLKICSCGKIHMIPNEKIDHAIKHDKNLLLICGSCGAATIIGAEEEQFGHTTVYKIYSSDAFINNIENINISDFMSLGGKKGIIEIIYDKGIKVPMKNGEYATSYFGDKFHNSSRLSMYEIQQHKDDIVDFYSTYIRNCGIVDMRRFINENSDEILSELSTYYIGGFNWEGTKYEK